jgi:hypothetical protein
LQARKIVLVEELAASFGVKTAVALARIRALEASGRLKGCFDERGKFIHVEDAELDALAAYITQCGRATLADIGREAARIMQVRVAPAPVVAACVQGEAGTPP